MLYSELEIIQEHGEELCYLRARDYTGTRRRVVLYSELKIIQEHGEQEEELCYTQS